MFNHDCDPENVSGRLHSIVHLLLLLSLYSANLLSPGTASTFFHYAYILAQFSFYRKNSLKYIFRLTQYLWSSYCMPRIISGGRNKHAIYAIKGLYNFIDGKNTNGDEAMVYHILKSKIIKHGTYTSQEYMENFPMVVERESFLR